VKHSQFTAPVIVMFLAGEEAGSLNPSGGVKGGGTGLGCTQ